MHGECHHRIAGKITCCLAGKVKLFHLYIVMAHNTHGLKIEDVRTHFLCRNARQIHKYLVKRHLSGHFKKVVFPCYYRNPHNLLALKIRVENRYGSHLVVPRFRVENALNQLFRIITLCHDHHFITAVAFLVIAEHKRLKSAMRRHCINQIKNCKITECQTGIITGHMCDVHDTGNRCHHHDIVFDNCNEFYKCSSFKESSVPICHHVV